MNVVGLILAGGAGSRLGGVRKGDLRLGGIPLHDRVAAIAGAQCTTLLYSSPEGPRVPSRTESFIELPDAPNAPAGPAAGLFTGAQWCLQNAPESLLLSVAVDTPFFPQDFVERARKHMMAEVDCVVGSWAGHHYPTVALWSPAPLATLLSSYPLQPRGPSVREIQRKLGAVSLDYIDLVTSDPFAGINTLADLLTLARRIKGK